MAKGIGILCIIAGHMGIEAISKVVFTFHVPLFFIISGYFLSRKADFRSFISKKYKGIIVPYIFTSFILIIAVACKDALKGLWNKVLPDMLAVFVQTLYGSGSNANYTLFDIKPIGAIWFLLALVWALSFVKVLIDKKYGVLLIILIAIISYITSYYLWLPWDIQAGGTAAVFVYIGAWFKETKKNLDIKWWLLSLGIIAFVLEIKFGVSVSVARNYYPHTVISIIGAVLISYSVLCLSKFCERMQLLKKFFYFYGTNSIIVLCYHLVFLHNAPWRKMFSVLGALPHVPLYLMLFVVQILIIALLTKFTLRNSWLRGIFNK